MSTVARDAPDATEPLADVEECAVEGEAAGETQGGLPMFFFAVVVGAEVDAARAVSGCGLYGLSVGVDPK